MAGITTQALNVASAAMGGSLAYPNYIAVGISGLVFASGNTVLGSEFDRNVINTYNFAIAEEVTMITDWSPTEISGCILKEVGVFNDDTVGAMSSRNVLAGSLVFDGEQELQIQQTYKFFI